MERGGQRVFLTRLREKIASDLDRSTGKIVLSSTTDQENHSAWEEGYFCWEEIMATYPDEWRQDPIHEASHIEIFETERRGYLFKYPALVFKDGTHQEFEVQNIGKTMNQCAHERLAQAFAIEAMLENVQTFEMAKEAILYNRDPLLLARKNLKKEDFVWRLCEPIRTEFIKVLRSRVDDKDR